MNQKSKPNSKFKVGDFAMLQGGQKIVEIVSKTFPEKYGKWRYDICYLDIDKVKNTVSGNRRIHLREEEHLETVTDPHLLLLIKKYEFETKIQHIKAELKQLETDVDKIEYALDIITPKSEEGARK
ncbi:hypothetical protein ABNB59_14790 [Paenibacillus larvae]|uniref:Uncharacterized protein n=6 Tax=root TaxID=1 RepID=R9VW30_9CAUD|nr:hypothetical protein [Paenibacillus larvae]YP_008320375.1 hypothetical protein IBBPl23_36 [Paenibacillus phage phiIBB_P123]YP_009193863.1 hypothetical protein HARRISON_50 [Paenibacillus phage Harrison]ALA12611.1 hypothetical protein PAISLEY_50 [Paenibacillus phage Paisley]AGN89353.1 hypothetical protein IBBPl23_36 [Paenibacillus phage phiIBB_P123]ALA12450.1 hypothetical protein HARRISON_50 [Paenibacillus phage Harrison]AQR76522.1 hypothetical protein BXP28_03150 [Paenibacillus larvae subsp